jgi:hypothetical protein
MTLPSATTKVHLDAGSDDPSQARSELATMSDAINSLITHLGTSSITSGSSVLSAAGGLAVSGSSLLTSLAFTTKTATYTALTTDRAKVINFTTAGVDLDFTASATLGDGWWCIARNSAASGDVSLDPNSTESINGSSTSIALRPGDMALVTCNGTALFALIMRAPATQTEMEAATNATAMVTPASVQWHPGVAKAWATLGWSAGVLNLIDSHNVTSLTDNGTGDFTVNFTTAFADADYVPLAICNRALNTTYGAIPYVINTPTVSACRFQVALIDFGAGSHNPVDPSRVHVSFFGDQ